MYTKYRQIAIPVYGFIAGMLMVTGAAAQEFTLGDHTAQTNESEVSVSWEYLDEPTAITGIGVDITFDDSKVTPKTTGGDVGDDVVGCVDDATATMKSCILVDSDRVRLVLNN